MSNAENKVEKNYQSQELKWISYISKFYLSVGSVQKYNKMSINFFYPNVGDIEIVNYLKNNYYRRRTIFKNATLGLPATN